MKKTRQEKREEEARILAEMDEAMQDLRAQKQEDSLQNEPKEKAERASREEDCMPQTMHCKRCKTLMENGVCPTCGFTVYIPMKKEKRDKIKLVVTAVAMVVAVVLFVILQFKK